MLAEALAAYQARDYAYAARLLYPLAVAGDPTALMTLGDMVEYGAFFPHDACLSTAFHDKAARHGNAVAMHYLANAYMTGGGVLRDPVTAVLWATAAAARGESGARTVIQAMWLHMSDAEFAQAQRRQLTLRPETAPPGDFYHAPTQWAASGRALARMGLSACHLPKYFSRP
jgi:TPR repeat protein